MALEDVSFEVEDGETVALVGPSGAGKSTLLWHLNGLLPQPVPDDRASARVHIAGEPVVKSRLAEVRRQVGLLFQNPDDQLFCPSVRDDVAFGPLNLGLDPDEVIARVTESLEAVGLAGFDSRSTMQLSVGERKRVCLAGVLACRPQLLVLDEPFSNLDPRSRRQLSGIIRRFDGTRLLATHDLDLVVDLCDRVVVLDAGRLHADGPTATILANRTLVERHGLEVPYRLQPSSGKAEIEPSRSGIVSYNSDDGREDETEPA